MRAIPSIVLVGLLVGCNQPAPDPASQIPAADRARATVIASPDQLIGGPKASGHVGDILLANTRVRFVIESAAAKSRSWVPVTGTILDADRVRPSGTPGKGPVGEDRLQGAVTRLGNLGVLFAEKVEIAADGADGHPAIVRVTGYDIPVPILESFAPSRRANVRAVTEYRLSPYADSLEIATTITDKTGVDQSFPVGDLFILGDYVTLFAPGIGSDRSKLVFATKMRYFAAFGGPVSYGYLAPGRKLTLLVPQDEIFGAGTDSINLPANGTATFTRHLVVGDGDVSSLLPEIVRREGGDPAQLGAVDGTAMEATTKAAVPGALVELANAEGPYAVAVAGDGGRIHAPTEAGAYEWIASAGAHPTKARGTVEVKAATSAPIAPAFEDTGRFALRVRDDGGQPIPARVLVHAMNGTSFGYVLSPDGSGGGALPPGTYIATASRGYEWEAAQATFTVKAGETVMVPLTLAHVVDTTGFVAVDSHTHTAMSVDSQLDPAERVAQALADGVDLVITTEHDLVYDLAPLAAEIAPKGLLATAIGCEISPVPGHINAYPAAPTADADTDGYWEVKWWREDADRVFLEDLWPKDIFAAIRKKLGAAVVQLNHPRSSTQGLFNWVGYDPKRGIAGADPAKLDMNWDVMEICNAGCSRDPSSDDVKALRDWFSFHSQGYVRGGVGVSDAHSSGSWLGRARSMVAVGADAPAGLRLDDVWASMKAGRMTVVDGPFVTASVRDDAGKDVAMGGLAKATGAKVALHVKVQAPSWIPTSRVRVFRNGTEVNTVELAPKQPAPVVRFDEDIALEGTAGDCSYVVIVDGDGVMAPVLGSQPRSITNAVFVDRDGNGKFDAPGL